MKKVIIAAIFAIGLMSSGQVRHEDGRHVVLPNSRLLGCRSSGCSQLWQSNSAEVNAIYPRQVIVDFFGSDHCPLGVEALYEKSVSVDELKTSIDEQYGKWALADNATLPVKLWRVEPERFAISLAVTKDRKMPPDEAKANAIAQAFDPRERSNVAEGGMKTVIYMAFTDTKCSGQ